MKKALTTLLMSVAIIFVCAAGLPEIGYWSQDEAGLPTFVFTGALPSTATLPDGTQAKYPDDPWFLLGNYRMTLFVHASGQYELISGEREWCRLNQGPKVNSGTNMASVDILDEDGTVQKTIPLVGMETIAADRNHATKEFGCGFARYGYDTEGLEISRTISVAPSTAYDNGIPAFILKVSIKNRGAGRTLRYSESVLANYVPIMYQRTGSLPVDFRYDFSKENGIAKCEFTNTSADLLKTPAPDKMSIYDGHPPVLFIAGPDATHDDAHNLSSSETFTLKHGESKKLEFVIGLSFDHSFKAMAEMADSLRTADDFRAEWSKVIPALEDEKDPVLRREMRWNACTLEAMATYSSYYKETKIPQGVIYDYYWGQHASARDNFQHALPLIYYNPELAKSVMRYMAARTAYDGELRLIEYGYGYAENMVYSTSDQQLFFFQLLAEYLRVTGDCAFLDEEVYVYPKECGVTTTMLGVAERCFNFLRFNVATGNHGLVRLLNSDWNDNVFAMNKVRYNSVIYSGESMMNTTMAICVTDNMTDGLNHYISSGSEPARARQLAEAMQDYRNSVNEAFLKDLGDRTFPRRMYFDGQAVGEDDMWLEPMGYLLQIKDFPTEKKKALYAEMQKRVYEGEKLGARQQEAPQQETDGLEKGSRENGGFWYSLNGPVVAGMKDVDTHEAWKLLKMMTLENLSRQYPHYWTSYWSASDNQESSLMGSQEGLPDQSWDYWAIPVYCAHPHAWPLYCYFRLKE